ncbi:MAG: hypothetical protein GEV04_11920 [Actinophytocola sp.]|nr:hypothetical protein [Actinophytocola sp.]
MTGAGATAGRRDDGRPWLIAGAACALAATGALLLTDEVRWLRMGIIAALWAALLGAFLATKHRKSAEHAWDSIADAQHIYELELEREITARREYELELEASTRRQVEREAQSEIQDLRTEVTALRDSLQQLLGGEVVYEQVELTEQSTRRRSMREEQNGVGAGGSWPRLVSGRTTALEEVADQRTQVISRVVTSSAPRARRARPRVVDEPRYDEPFPQEQDAGYEAFPAEPAPPAEPVRARYYRAELPAGSQQDDEPYLQEHPSASEFSLDAYANGSRNGVGDSYESPTYSPFDGGAQESFDAFGTNGHVASVNGNGRHRPSPPRPPKHAHNDGSDTGDLSALIAANGRGSHAADQQEQEEHSWFTPASPVTPQANGHVGAHREPEPASNHSLPPGALEIQRQGRPGGRRRKPEPDEAVPSGPVVPETPTVRAVSSGEDDFSFPGVNGANGRHVPAGQPQEPTPRASMQDEAGGSHASGRSVHDLLAAHGKSAPTRRHRYKD